MAYSHVHKQPGARQLYRGVPIISSQAWHSDVQPSCSMVQLSMLLAWTSGRPRLDEQHTPPPPTCVSTMDAWRVRSCW